MYDALGNSARKLFTFPRDMADPAVQQLLSSGYIREHLTVDHIEETTQAAVDVR